MAEIRRDFRVDVTAVTPGSPGGSRPVEIAGTLVADREAPRTGRPVIAIGIPGGTYRRDYWDLRPPGRSGYSMASWLAARGVVFIACDYLGGGDSSRPPDGDFMTLEACADAAHEVFCQLRAGLEKGTLTDAIGPLPDPLYIGVGHSLGGFITIMQQGRYGDFPAIGLFAAPPGVIANVPEHEQQYAGATPAEQRQEVAAANAKTAELTELPPYHTTSRMLLAPIFYTPGLAGDLRAYDEQKCQTVISRVTGTDVMTPGIARDMAAKITSPVFLAFGDQDVSPNPRAEPAGFPASPDITVTVIDHMAHMHNFHDTREKLWSRFHRWVTALDGAPRPLPG